MVIFAPVRKQHLYKYGCFCSGNLLHSCNANGLELSRGGGFVFLPVYYSNVFIQCGDSDATVVARRPDVFVSFGSRELKISQGGSGGMKLIRIWWSKVTVTS